jgi:hypothetical protein
MLNRNILVYGHEELPPSALPLRAGPLTMLFEPDNAFLRYIRLGDHEVVRNVYAVVRDQNWNTIAWKVSNLRTDARADSFQITFDVECREREVHFVWKGILSGAADGKISFSFNGEAKSNFRRNRIGICVLHPIVECAGKTAMIEHTNGAREQTIFPETHLTLAAVQRMFERSHTKRLPKFTPKCASKEKFSKLKTSAIRRLIVQDLQHAAGLAEARSR